MERLAKFVKIFVHKVQVCLTGFKIGLGDIMDRMPSCNLRASGLGDGLSNSSVRKFQSKNDFFVILSNFVAQFGDSFCRSFGLLSATWKCGQVVEAVVFNEIVKGKAIGNDKCAVFLLSKTSEVLVELREVIFELREVVLDSLSVGLVMVNECLSDSCCDLYNIFRARPDMFVIFGIIVRVLRRLF